MWPLRQNVQYNKQYFFKDIFLFVFAIHLILLGVLFVCESGKFHQERFVIDTKSLQSTVVFMPLQKRVPESTVGVAGSKNSGARKVMSHDEYQKKLAKGKKKKPAKIKKSTAKQQAIPKKQVIKPVEKKVVQPAEKKQPAKKSPTMLRQEKNSSLAKAAADKKKLQADAAAKALADKKALEKKAADKKALVLKEQQKLADKMKADKEKKTAADKIAADKKASDKALLDKIAADKKKIESVKIEPVQEVKKIADQIIAPVQKEVIAAKVEPVIEEEDVSDEKEDVSDDNSKGEDEDDDLDNISFVGSRDLEMMLIKEQIQAEIVKYYKPPVGISKKAVCELSALVGPGGKATRVVVKKGSGSMANDVCARAALLKVAFPKEVIGREITIALGQ